MKKLKEFIVVGVFDNRRLIAVDAQSNPLDKSTFICKYEDGGDKWRVIDRATGLLISHGKTKKECIQRFNDKLSDYHYYKETNPYYKKQITQFNELREKEVAEWQALVN